MLIHYKPLEIVKCSIAGVDYAIEAMRLPKQQGREKYSISENMTLARKLVKAGDDHAKFTRGITVHFKMNCQIGWLIEYLTYRVGVECLSSSSSMHNELIKLTGIALAENKQVGLPDKVYIRIEMVTYQACRHMYCARRSHRHPDWQIFCDWVETLPYFKDLIYPEGNK